jgi:hypothetical protein
MTEAEILIEYCYEMMGEGEGPYILDKKKLSPCHSVHHKSNMDYNANERRDHNGNEPRPPW